MEHLKSGNLLSCTAIGIAILALVISIVTFKKTDNKIQNFAADETQNIVDESRLVQVQLNTASRLHQLKQEVVENQTYDEVADDISQLRMEFAAEYRNATLDAQEEWSEIDADLESLERKLREHSEDSLSTFDSLISRLEK